MTPPTSAPGIGIQAIVAALLLATISTANEPASEQTAGTVRI